MKKLYIAITVISTAAIVSLMSHALAYKSPPENEKSRQQISIESKDTGSGPEGNDEYYSKVGYDLMANDAVGFLKYGLADTKVLNMLGEPEEKSKLKRMEYDGEKHQTWHYRAKGIQLGMIGAKNRQKIETIKIDGPCAFKTRRNIGLGSTKEEVLRVYKKEIDLSETNPAIYSAPSRIIAGTIYGGIFFEFKNNRVSSIFIGAGAE